MKLGQLAEQKRGCGAPGPEVEAWTWPGSGRRGALWGQPVHVDSLLGRGRLHHPASMAAAEPIRNRTAQGDTREIPGLRTKLPSSFPASVLSIPQWGGSGRTSREVRKSAFIFMPKVLLMPPTTRPERPSKTQTVSAAPHTRRSCTGACDGRTAGSLSPLPVLLGANVHYPRLQTALGEFWKTASPGAEGEDVRDGTGVCGTAPGA